MATHYKLQCAVKKQCPNTRNTPCKHCGMQLCVRCPGRQQGVQLNGCSECLCSTAIVGLGFLKACLSTAVLLGLSGKRADALRTNKSLFLGGWLLLQIRVCNSKWRIWKSCGSEWKNNYLAISVFITSWKNTGLIIDTNFGSFIYLNCLPVLPELMAWFPSLYRVPCL